MAGAKLSPRQKMINMMYLVLTALLALNVSREVMDAFYEVMVSQEASIETVEKQNESIYNAFEAAYAANPVKTKDWREKANEVKVRSEKLYAQIEDFKRGVIEASGGADEESGDPNKPAKMDDLESSPNYFLIQGNGATLKASLADYREFMKTNTGDSPLLTSSIENTFDLSDHKHDGSTISWEQHKFEHFPLISVLTFLTKMQSDVRTTEANVIDYLQKNISARDIKVTGVKPIVIPKSTYVTKGDNYEAQILLAAFDDTQDPTFIINGEEIPAEDIIGGVANISFPTSKTGTQKWNGEIRLITNGETVPYLIEEQTYNVAPPNVVIAATKMNVLYRGVDNPLEISVPGYDPENIKVSNAEIKKDGKGNYTADVSKYRGGEIDVKVSVKDGDSWKSMGSKKYRIKSLPDAAGSIFGKTDGLMSANLIKKAKVEAKFNNFDFELPLKVTSFQIIVPPFAPIDCKGNTLNSNAKAALDKAKPGTPVIIRYIKASTKKGIRPKVAPITIDLN